MKWNKFPSWLNFGILIFPIVIIISLIIGLFGGNYLVWMILPSIVFEELFEGCCYAFSNSEIVSFIFSLVFWFVVGVLIGRVVGK
ncbi:MAG: hypothetical protein KJ718_03585 [Nanoarchaeota archaeon]|nr:hypothetical protein [Nanoarchaeota archaeon]MBU1051612.1 hypothetical protein [Nanoarchaeota archaeon]MBU1988085.1 hypothetical protein [Nanoarchaeota archaeon]